MAHPLRGSPAVYTIFFCSGVSGLGYELVWTRMFGAGLGHEMPGLLAAVGAFFGGFAVGAWLLDGRVSRSRVPGRWYAALELVIAAWALVSLALIPALGRWAALLIGLDPSPWRHWLVALAVPMLGLLPATAAMGATLPAMERLASRLQGSGADVAGIYAVNTAGAVVGTLATTFLIVPLAGYSTALVALAAVNVLCAVATLLGPAAGEAVRPEVAHDLDDPPTRRRLGATVLATGLLGIGYEVLGVRVMAQVLENTVYSFASALSVYLLGTAVGAALYQRLARKRSFSGPLAWLLPALTLACVVGVLALSRSGELYEETRRFLGGGGGGMAASVGAEVMLAAVVFGPATLLMGAVLGHLVQAARGRGGGVGRALALNTLGGAAAPVVFGVIALSLVGSLWSLLTISFGYLLLMPPGGWRLARLVPAAAAAALVLALPSSLLLVTAPANQRIVASREGVMAAVAVTEDPARHRLLKVNDRFSMGGTVQSFADRRQAHIPLLLHAAPRTALFLGLGSGMTAGAATDHPGLEVTGVELLPEVVELLPSFAPENRLDRLEAGGRLHVADARRFVGATPDLYDVIVADLFHPARDGAGGLYTLEHFRAVRDRLADGGLFCQWLPLYQIDLETLRLVVRTFLAIFPAADAYLAHFNVATPMLGLMGSAEPRRYPPDWYARRVTDPGLAAALDDVALRSEMTLFGCRVADRDGLLALAGEGPLNTDDHPRVVFRAPAFAYAEDQAPYGRLLPLLERLPPAASLLEDAGDGGGADAAAALAARIDAYRAARDLFLRGSIDLAEGRRETGVERYLESVRASRDFVTAYVTCLQMARELARRDPAGARSLLTRLRAANPADPRASQELRGMR